MFQYILLKKTSVLVKSIHISVGPTKHQSSLCAKTAFLANLCQSSKKGRITFVPKLLQKQKAERQISITTFSLTPKKKQEQRVKRK